MNTELIVGLIIFILAVPFTIWIAIKINPVKKKKGKKPRFKKHKRK